MPIIRTRHVFDRRRAIIAPGWVKPYAVVDWDFANNRQFGSPWIGNLTSVRSSTADYVGDAQGLYWSVGANIPRLSNKGLLIEKATTNRLLRCRDLTDAAWVKVNVTAALDQVGIDGVANSASSITATAGNGTILQTVVLGSSARRVSVFVKRITGTGTINLTGDGTTFTAITVTSNWTRVNLASATVTNPITGFQIVTSGDAIAVDFVQNEIGPFITSPILTGAAQVTRSVDDITLTALPPFLLRVGSLSIYAEFTVDSVNNGTSQTAIGIDDGTTNNRIALREGGTGFGAWFIVDATTTQANISLSTVSTTGVNKMAGSLELNNFNAAINAAAGTPDTSGTVPLAAMTKVRLGDAGTAGTAPLNGYLRRVAFSTVVWSNQQMKDITA